MENFPDIDLFPKLTRVARLGSRVLHFLTDQVHYSDMTPYDALAGPVEPVTDWEAGA